MKILIDEYFDEIETEKSHYGYNYNVSEAITIAIPSTFCGLRNMKQIQQ